MAATNWEYTYAQSGQLDLDQFRDGLNALGSLGWECIGLAPTDRMVGLNQLVAVLRRPVEPMAAPADLAADWHPDPYGRADHRYWDGHRWTEQVSKGGQVGEDYPTTAPMAGGFRKPITVR